MMKKVINLALVLALTISVYASNHPRRRSLRPGPSAQVVSVINLDDESLSHPVVTLTTGYFTAIELPAPPKQMVSKLLDQNVISQQKGKEDAGSTIYLTAEIPNRRSNVLIETGYGVINFIVVTVKGDAYTHTVKVKQSRHEAEVESLRRQLASVDGRLAHTLGELEAAQGDLVTAKLAAMTAFREGRVAGLDEQRQASAQEFLGSLDAWKLKRKQQQRVRAWISSYLERKPEGANTDVTARKGN
ncbi:MAG: hypothetical protein H0U76_28495 [Ktedonobacteraceae bacterium]|nr:hypothetical protein [Ktedonobacteraceae bacterium]